MEKKSKKKVKKKKNTAVTVRFGLKGRFPDQSTGPYLIIQSSGFVVIWSSGSNIVIRFFIYSVVRFRSNGPVSINNDQCK